MGVLPCGVVEADTSALAALLIFADIPAQIQAIAYDPNRSANIALRAYADGEKRYILAPRGVQRKVIRC